MERRNPKISVILVCYNQEDVIERALNSVLIQKKYLFELIISDDCSPDNTWSIIKRYEQEYPDIIKAYRHEKNLGAYENIQSTYNKINGEIVFFLSGDDSFGTELFKKTCEAVFGKNLDYKNDRFCVITDFAVINGENEQIVINRNILVQKHDPFSLKFRGIIYNRALGESISTFNDRKVAYIARKKNASIPTSLQEGYTDIIPFYHTKFFFYLPYLGNYYYSGIGVSSKVVKHKKEYLEGLIEYCDTIPNYFTNLNQFDKNWLIFHKAKTEYLLNPNLGRLWKYFINFSILSKDPLRNFFLMKEIKTFLLETFNFIKNKPQNAQ